MPYPTSHVPIRRRLCSPTEVIVIPLLDRRGLTRFHDLAFYPGVGTGEAVLQA
jgi:hypothetical protein